MPLDLDEIRARHEPYADTRVGQDIAALLSEVARLRSELAAAQDTLSRSALKLPEELEVDAIIQEWRNKWMECPPEVVERMRVLTVAGRDANLSIYGMASRVVVQVLREHVDAMSPEARRMARDRALAELRAAVAEENEREDTAAAQAGPVVEWYATTIGEAARVGMFWMSNGPGGWTLRVRLLCALCCPSLTSCTILIQPPGSAQPSRQKRFCGCAPGGDGVGWGWRYDV